MKNPESRQRLRENVFTVGALAAGQTVTLAWPITVLAPVAATRYGPLLMLIHAEGVAVDGTTPVSTGVLSRARNQFGAKASSAESATEPVTADAAIARCRSTERVSVDSADNQSNAGSIHPAIGANGRFVAFESWADNLVPADTNGSYDVFVHQLHHRKTEIDEPAGADFAGE